jgi:hypothetical protein
MDNFSSGFIAQISYLEDKIQKFRKISLGAILRDFWDILGKFFGFWDDFKILYFLFFFN